MDALNPPKIKSRAAVLADATLTAALVGDVNRCLAFGDPAVALIRELDVSITADLLRDVIPVLLHNPTPAPSRSYYSS